MVAAWDERVETQSPSSAGFSIEGGRAQITVFFGTTPYTEVKTILGHVTTSGDGKLQRTRPISHPVYPWMVAERISNIQGIGSATRVASVAPLFVDANNLAYYAGYQAYATTIEFTPRPYALLPDSAITSTQTSWTDETGATVQNKFTNEYLRYTDYEILPDLDVITAQHGQMVFRAAAVPPSGTAFTGMPKVYIPKAVVKVRWFQVPYSYIESSSSLILRYLGYINQTDFVLGSRTWPAGSLLHRGVVVKRYTPPIPDTKVIAGASVYSTAKWCDIEFVWEFTRRVNASSPSPAPSNTNWITEGHNCMPWYRDRKFYYTTVSTDVLANQYPTYPSVPFQLLFTDPDAA